LRRRPGHASGGRRGHAPQPERRNARGVPSPPLADPRRAIPSRGLSGAARCQRPVRAVPGGDERKPEGGRRAEVKSLPLEVAVRYLRSRPSRLVSSVSLLSIAGIALGVAALVVAMGLLSGYRTEIREKLI